MTNYNAQVMMNSGSWLTALQRDQARVTDMPVEVLQDIAEDCLQAGNRVIAIAVPAPVRGYAVMQRTPGGMQGTMHVLDGQPDAAYRALFSRVIEAAKRVGFQKVSFPNIFLAPNVVAQLNLIGDVYGLEILDVDAVSETEETPVEAETETDTDTDTEIDTDNPSEVEAVPELADMADQIRNGETVLIENPDIEQDVEGEEYRCDDCDRTFGTLRGMRIHSASHK